jgi:hypothetical protein
MQEVDLLQLILPIEITIFLKDYPVPVLSLPVQDQPQN